MGLIRTTVVGGVVLGALVWVFSPWVAKMDIVQAASRLEYEKVAQRMDVAAMNARQSTLVNVTERARPNENAVLAYAATRPITIDSMMLVSSRLRSDPDYRRYSRSEEGAVGVSSGFWRGLSSFSFQVAGTNDDRPSSILKVHMAFSLSAMGWKVVGIDLLPPS